jgi:3-methyladenine DNA glycosylase AlkD
MKQGKKKMDAKATVRLLKTLSKPENLDGMSRFGINTSNALGITVTELRKVAKTIGKDHELAMGLWDTKIHEARMLASFIDEPVLVTEQQMEAWAKGFDSWDLCDECCGDLFDKTEFAYKKAAEWSERREEYVKRAGFALMAALSVHDKRAADSKLLQFLPIIERESDDERNFVRKAVNWALRNIGKRNLNLNKAAIATAKRIKERDTKSARWIASDALRELTGEGVTRRLNG